MREIKFRGWDEKNKEMVYNINLLFSNRLNDCFEEYEECGLKIMQYTGLKDKNGVEIYEGDILLNKSIITQPDGKLTTKIIGDIQILNGMTYLIGKTWQDVDGENIRIREYKALMLSPEIFKIIGNIYENPELLEGNKC